MTTRFSYICILHLILYLYYVKLVHWSFAYWKFHTHKNPESNNSYGNCAKFTREFGWNMYVLLYVMFWSYGLLKLQTEKPKKTWLRSAVRIQLVTIGSTAHSPFTVTCIQVFSARWISNIILDSHEVCVIWWWCDIYTRISCDFYTNNLTHNVNFTQTYENTMFIRDLCEKSHKNHSIHMF
jgi:hypothetical protein